MEKENRMGYAIIFIWALVIIVIFCFSSSNKDPNLENAKHGQISKIEYQDHTYVIWSINVGGGIVHDPDCKCLKGKE